MTLDDFMKRLELHSADLSRWPPDLVRPALALIRSSAEAHAAFDGALKLDAALRSYNPPPARLEALEERIMRAVANTRHVSPPVRNTWRTAWLFAPGGGLVAAAVIGFFLGLQPAPSTDSGLFDAVAFAPDQIINDDDGDF
jgi:hypothetical protein